MGEGRKMLERLWNSNSLGNPFSGYSTLRKNMTSYDIIQKHAWFPRGAVTMCLWLKPAFSAGCTASFLGLTCWIKPRLRWFLLSLK